MKVSIKKQELTKMMNQENIKIIDCRFSLEDSSEGEKRYEESHLIGATYFDLEKQLSSPVKKHGGRHPLPDIKKFKKEIEKAGINRNQTVIIYDDGGMQFSSRVWWLLTYMGHEKVYVLEEGFNGWKEAKLPLTNEIPIMKKTHFEVDIQQEMLSSYEEVKQIVLEKEKYPMLVDSRTKERYLGESEPIDRIPGHIPGALNKFWGDGISDGSFKNKVEQKERFADLDPEKPVIVYCGSGVTAVPNILALKIAGFKNVKLYAGSYSDWVSYEDNLICKGTEK